MSILHSIGNTKEAYDLHKELIPDKEKIKL